jgi:PAS domain S-box-containing protein
MTRRDPHIVRALQSAGEVGRDLLAADWSLTPLGRPEHWPSSLSMFVRVMLGSRFSIWMAWGPELTFFCNDAYRRNTLGKKYPWALGRPARDVWVEIWPDIGPRIETVLKTGDATWDESLMLFLERSGYVEETYHTFSYSPLIDDAGDTAGMLCVVSEDTERVVGERRMATLREVGSEPATGRDEYAYLLGAARHLDANPRSLPFTITYLFDAEARTAQLAASSAIPAGHAAAPLSLELGQEDSVWPAADLARGEEVIVADLERRFDRLPTGAWSQPPSSAVLLPLLQPVAHARPYGFLVVGVNRFRPLDAGYLSFLKLLAAQLASGVAAARAYDAERRRAEQLAELDRAKTAFFTNVSHELRTPLTLLIGPAQDALADRTHPLAATQRERVETIVRNGDRLLKLVGTLLDFSRLESGSVQPVFEPVELGRYTAELASMFDSAVKRAGLTLEIDCPPLPAPVYIDREMWAKIVLNLLSNALKFTFEGTITVRVDSDEAAARLSIADTGIGVDPTEQPRLFERFHQVPGARGRSHEGSGIGLALVGEFAALHGGAPTVHSQPGVGSTFVVAIPFGSEHLPPGQVTRRQRELPARSEVAGFVAEATRWLRSAGTDPGALEPTSGATDGPRVLIVDDNADMREYVANLLSERYLVVTAPDGQAAYELAQSQPPDLVLTDVMMPRLDGFGLLAALRGNPLTVHIPVVMLSARAGEEGVIEGLEAGADDYLVKPFSARELMARVHANLELDRVRRAQQQLQRSQRLLDQAERLAEVGSWEIDLPGGAMRGSDQLLRLLGLGPSEFGAMDFRRAIGALVHPDDAAHVTATLQAAIASRRGFESEARLAGGGAPRWIFLRGEVVCDEAGAPSGLRGFIQDITRRKQVEQAMATAAAAREAAQREHRIADALQRSLLPADTFESAFLEVATYYQAGVAGTRVGGDWYDVIDLGAGRTALVIGDVAGRGVRAASVMGQLRAAVRAYARLDLPPAEVLSQLDAMVRELAPGQIVTCVYAVYDPSSEQLSYASAGHLPPLWAAPGRETERLPGPTGPPLGAGPARFTEHERMLSTGELIVLYTDGLVERRDEQLDQGIESLAAAISTDAETIALLPAELVRALAPEGSEDDIAILIARASDRSGQRTAELDIPAAASALSDGRRFAVTTLQEWHVPELTIENATLIVSELLTNAIVHGFPPIRLRLRRTPEELAIEVDDAGSAMPRKLQTTPDDLHGRGLAIVADLGDRWAARPNGHGKTVWTTIPLPPDPELGAGIGGR